VDDNPQDACINNTERNPAIFFPDVGIIVK